MDFRRVDEIRAAAYAVVTGAVFIMFPETLAGYNPVFGGPNAAFPLGLSLQAAAVLHMYAIYLNGRAPRISRWVRILACLWHIIVIGSFMLKFYVAGAWWGLTSMALVMSMLLSALHRGVVPKWGGHSWMRTR